MLIQQTKMHFLEMGNLLIEARKIFDKKGKKYSEYCEYVERQFGFKETAHRYMRDVCERFNGKSQELLPFKNYQMLYQVRNLTDVEIDELLEGTFTTKNGIEKKGRDLNDKELREALKEKRELEKALEEEKRRTEEEKKKIEEEKKRELNSYYQALYRDMLLTSDTVKTVPGLIS